MFTPSRRTTLPLATLTLVLTAGCGSAADTNQAASTAASTAASSKAAPSAAPSAPSPAGSATPGRTDQGQCPVTPQALQEATKLTWKLGRTLPEHPLEYDETIKASTCAFISEDAAVKDDYDQPLVLRIDIATGANAAALEKSTLEGCAEASPAGTLRAPRGGGSGKVCDAKGSVEEAIVVKDGTALSLTMFSDSKKILKDFSPAFEAVVAAIAG